MGGLVGAIWAQSTDGVIGKDGDLPWSVPEDLALFKELTSGETVLMGRKTWDSLPESVRPLPGRKNFVVSQDPTFMDGPGYTVFRSVEEAVNASTTDWLWIIGGGSIYAQTVELCDRLEITTVNVEVPDGDAFAPDIPEVFVSVREDPPGDWKVSKKNGVKYKFTSYAKR